MQTAVLNQVADARRDGREDLATTAPGFDQIRTRSREVGKFRSDFPAMAGTAPTSNAALGRSAGEVTEVRGQVIRAFPGARGGCADGSRCEPHRCSVPAVAAFRRFRSGTDERSWGLRALQWSGGPASRIAPVG